MRSYYSLLTICLCTAIAVLHIGACNSPTNNKPNDNLAIKIDTVTDAPSEVYDIAEYDTIHIDGYTLYFEPYDSTREYIEPPMHWDTSNYRLLRNRREVQKLEKCSNCFDRREDTLTLKFDNGASFKYVDISEEDNEDFAHYEFGGVENGYYFVVGYFWEWADVRMIDRITGYSVTLLRKPQFAPSNKTFITTSSDIKANIFSTAISYYSIVSNDSIRKEFSLELSNTWGPKNVSWLNNATAIIEKESSSGTDNPPYKYAYTKMTITKP